MKEHHMHDKGSRFSVMINPAAWQFDMPASSTLLEAALLAGIRLPSSCRNGTCRTCMCRLISGQVSYKIEWPGLLAEEKSDGVILPCVACPQSDLVIEVPGAKRI
jgi:ferredoxin